MLVRVFLPSRDPVSSFETKFALKQDKWNDYSFQTLYHLSYRRLTKKGHNVVFIGGVKILRIGQTESDGIQIQEDFDQLGSEFCSIGTSLDYYQRLNSLPELDRNAILKALRDVIANPELQSKFSVERGWAKSLFRDDDNPSAFISDATAIYSGNFSDLPDLTGHFSFEIAGGSGDLRFDFNAPEPDFYFGSWRRLGPGKHKVLLPRRMVVIVGRNGSGKSTLLSRLARVAFASPAERQDPELQALGVFKPNGIGFMRIIAISYSAFDSFIVPGVYEDDLRQIAEDIEEGEGRYVHCGLRDTVAEVREDLSKSEAVGSIPDERRKDSTEERRTSTHLKSLDRLADEFSHLMRKIRIAGQLELFNFAIEPLLSDPSFNDLEFDTDRLVDDGARDAFLSWSTGHKIALHVVASLVARATRRSLVLFDEPEMHLHPPMIAALMHAVRIVLEELDAFAIVATHSPVVLQETLARHVLVIRRHGGSFTVHQPELETFGENVGILTYDTFGLTASSTDFHRILDLLIEGCDSPEQVEALFSPGLSGQARAFVMAGFAAKGRKS